MSAAIELWGGSVTAAFGCASPAVSPYGNIPTCRYETEGGGGFTNEGMPPSYDYFSCGVRGGDDGLDEIAGPALDSEDAEGESTRRAQVGAPVKGTGIGLFYGKFCRPKVCDIPVRNGDRRGCGGRGGVCPASFLFQFVQQSASECRDAGPAALLS